MPTNTGFHEHCDPISDMVIGKTRARTITRLST